MNIPFDSYSCVDGNRDAHALQLIAFRLTHAHAYASANCVQRPGLLDGVRVESDGRLGEDAAVELGAGFESGGGLDQKDARLFRHRGIRPSARQCWGGGGGEGGGR